MEKSVTVCGRFTDAIIHFVSTLVIFFLELQPTMRLIKFKKVDRLLEFVVVATQNRKELREVLKTDFPNLRKNIFWKLERERRKPASPISASRKILALLARI